MATSDLRNALRYVRRFRDRVFVICLDGPVIADDNFGNVLLDIAVLHSLGIRVVLVHGISRQIQDWSATLAQPLSDVDGTDPVDEATLRIAKIAAGEVSHQVLSGLATTNQLQGAIPNAIKAKPTGVVGGVDHFFSGRVDQADLAHLRVLLDHDIVPVISPIGADAAGQAYRLNSDEVGARLARDLQAKKLIYLTDRPRVQVGGEYLRHLSAGEMGELLEARRDDFEPEIVSKVEFALQACRGGVARAHIIDGREDECLVSEIFSNEGIGTMVHANEYQHIRAAQPRDVSVIWALAKPAMAREELLPRTRTSIQKEIDNYYVFETDGAVLGCVAVHLFPEEKKAEIAALHVSPMHTHEGVGSRLARYAEELARSSGAATVFCLSTQAYTYFQQKHGYEEAPLDLLPPSRREQYQKSARNSKILAKQF